MGRALGHHRGGIQGLIAFLEEHLPAVEADFARYYSPPDNDLKNLFTGKLTYRRVLNLIKELPPGSQTSKSVEGIEVASWTNTDELLAAICDITAMANWQRGGGKGSRPEPIKRPHSITPRQNDKALTREEFDREMFGI